MAVWRQVPLGDVTSISGRIGWKGLTAKEYTKTGPLFLSVHALNYGDLVDFRDANHITQHRYDESPEIMLRSGDVLICKDGAGIGKVGIIGDLPSQATINSSLLLVRTGSKLSPRFLYHCLCSPGFQSIVKSRIEGATTPHLYQRDINTFPIPLPSLEQQEQIVAVLDEAFEGLARARANAEANLKDAQEFFGEFVQQSFDDSNDSWPKKSLPEISENLDGRRVPITKGDRISGNVPYYGASGVVDHVRDHLFDEDLLLVSEDGANLLARTYPIAFSISGKAWVNNHAHVLRFGDLTTQRFVELYLNSISLQAFVSGMAQPKLNQRSLNSIQIPFPTDGDRARIVELGATIQQETKVLSELYSGRINDLDALRQSLLQKAFSGELT